MAAAVLLAVTLLASGCGGSESTTPDKPHEQAGDGAPQPGGKITIAIAGEADGFLPSVNRWSSSTLFQARTIFDPLAAFDEQGNARPYLAESFTPNSDYTQWIIKARPDVTFHNGEKLDGEALRLHFTKMKESLVTGSVFKMVTDIAVTDPLSVTLTMSAPWTHFPVVLASQTGFVAAPAQVNAHDSVGAIGTGPFKLKSWTPGSPFVATKNEGYWRKDPSGNALPYLDEVEFHPVPDPQTRNYGLQAGTYDMIQTESADQVRELLDRAKTDPTGDVRVLPDESEGTEAHVMFNNQTGPFVDKNLRLAAASAIDRQALVDQLFHGQYVVANGPFTKDSIWGEADNYPPYDPQKARQLVEAWSAAHGGAKPAVKLTVVGSADFLRVAQEIVKQWNDVGFQADIITVAESAGTVMLVTGGFEAVMFNFYDRPDPDALYHYWISSSIGEPNAIGLNFARYKSDVVDQALNAGRQSADDAERAKQYKKVWNDFAENVPVIWLYHVRWVIGYRSNLRGVGELRFPAGPDQDKKVEPVTWGNLFVTGVWKKR
jgi:peptide/nickel transport system substrate-binding protein